MRFLHTADLQLGLKLRFVAGEHGARVRAQRFDTLRRIAAVAVERDAQAVVIAGDLFDDNSVGPDTLQLAADALATFAPLPVLVLPGNHDAATEHSALARLEVGDHVRVLDRREPLAVAGALFYPCPLQRRHETGDPTDWLPERTDAGVGVRVAVAHGGVLEFGESSESPNRIDADAVLAKGFDYLALGDWHGTFRYRERAWYPGTPEPTHWTEKEPGNVLLVDLPGPGAPPRVEPIPVARTRWVDRQVLFERDEDVAVLAAWFEQLPEKSWTLVQLSLGGHLSLGARVELERLLETQSGRIACLRVRADDVSAAPTEDDLQRLALEGFVGEAVARLRGETAMEAADALRLLYRLHRELEEETR